MTLQDTIDRYKKEISKNPFLKNEEAMDLIDTILFSKWRTSRIRARKRLENKSVRTVFQTVMSFVWKQGKILDEYKRNYILDLIQTGNVKMLRIISKRKYLINIRKKAFIPYLKKCVRMELLRYVIEQGNPMKIPVAVYLKEEHHRKFRSLDAPLTVETETTLGELTPDPRIDIAKETENVLLMNQINEILNRKGFCNNLEKLVLEMRFGFFDGKFKTYKEIGQLVGKYEDTVSKVENAGIQKIQEAMSIEP